MAAKRKSAKKTGVKEDGNRGKTSAGCGCGSQSSAPMFSPRAASTSTVVALSTTSPSPSCGNPLTSFSQQHQEQDNWCWSAVTVSIHQYYVPGTLLNQCKLVNYTKGLTNCCDPAAARVKPCNTGVSSLDNPLQIVGNFASKYLSAVSLTTIKNEIDNCRPLAIGIFWNGGGGHALSIYGYEITTSSTQIRIGDPWYGDSWQDYPTFPSGYQGGATWVETDLTNH